MISQKETKVEAQHIKIKSTSKLQQSFNMNTAMTFNDFIAQTKSAMAIKVKSHEKQTVVKEMMLRYFTESGVQEIENSLRTMGAQGGDLGDRVVHSDADLSVVYGQIPPHYQSGVFDHAAYCCTMTLEGTEKTSFYAEKGDGSLELIKSKEVKAGEVLEFAPETIRSMENPGNVQTRFFQCYLGDIRKLDQDRHVWEWKTQKKLPFSSDALIQQGVERMSSNKNQEGLAKLVEVLPTMKPIVEAAQ